MDLLESLLAQATLFGATHVGQTGDETQWMPVDKNAEMVAWAAQRVSKCPYPLDVALERFYTGDTLKYSVVIHYEQDAVTSDLPARFHTYNGRQTIEAGIGKNVFQFIYHPADGHPTGAAAVQKLHFCAQLTILASLLSPCPCTMAISFLKLKSSSSPL